MPITPAYLRKRGSQLTFTQASDTPHRHVFAEDINPVWYQPKRL